MHNKILLGEWESLRITKKLGQAENLIVSNVKKEDFSVNTKLPPKHKINIQYHNLQLMTPVMVPMWEGQTAS